VLLLDDDVRPQTGLAGGHAAHHVTPGLVVVGYMPVAAAKAPDSAPVPDALYRQEYARRIADYERDPDTVLRHLWGGNISMRREDALRVGLVSTSFRGRRHEDRDLGLRCLEAGLTGVFDRSLAARHEYRRSDREFLEDARAQGAERVLLHHAHRDLLGSLDPGVFSADLPSGLGWVVNACRRPIVGSAVSRGLRAVLRVTVAFGWRAGEVAILKLARRVELTAGAQEAVRDIAKAAANPP
jgi:hypothetical protein